VLLIVDFPDNAHVQHTGQPCVIPRIHQKIILKIIKLIELIRHVWTFILN